MLNALLISNKRTVDVKPQNNKIVKKQKVVVNNSRISFSSPYEYKINILNDVNSDQFFEKFQKYLIQQKLSNRVFNDILCGIRATQKAIVKKSPELIVIIFHKELIPLYEKTLYLAQKNSIKVIFLLPTNQKLLQEICGFKNTNIFCIMQSNDNDKLISDLKNYCINCNYDISWVINPDVYQPLKISKLVQKDP